MFITFCKIYFFIWTFCSLVVLLPSKFSVSRAFKEYHFWLRFIYQSYRRFINPWCEDPYETNYIPLHSTVGLEEDFPNNDLMPSYITYSRENFTLMQAKEDTIGFDSPFVVKHFAVDLLARFDHDYVMETFNADKYDFEYGTSFERENFTDGRKKSYNHVELEFQEGLKRMLAENLYLRFSHVLAQNNPEFDTALESAMMRLGPSFSEMVGSVQKANRLCFIGMGADSRTHQHAAITDNWFFQVSGTKKWILVPPEYTPYMKPHFTPTIAMGSLLPLYNESMGIPRITIFTEPGDLLYFPGFYWHEVHNVGDEMNFGCGIRPREAIVRIFSIFNPLFAKPSGTFGIYLAIWPDAVRTVLHALPQKLSGWGLSFADFDVSKHNNWWAREKSTKNEI